MSDQPEGRPGKPASQAVLAEAFSPSRVLPALSTGAVVGLIEVVVSMSFAVLVFGKPMASNLDRAIGLALFGGALNLALVSLLASLSGAVGGNQDVPAAILSLAVTGILAAMPPGAGETQTTATVMVGVMAATLLTGLTLTLLGAVKLGGLVRFLPYPVVGGFLAGTGWLLITGAIGTMTGLDTTGMSIAGAFSPELMVRWLPGALFAVVFYAVSLRSSHFLLLPGALVGGATAFYLVAWLLGYTPAELSAAGWLMGPFPQGGLWQPPTPAELSQVYWPAIWSQAPNFVTLVIMTTIGVLLNTTGLELAANRDADLNRDLRAAGLGNLASGAFGGLPGYHQLSASVLAIKFGGGSRLAGLAGAAILLVVLFFGGAALSIVPTFIVGGLIFVLGIDFLYTWVYQAWRRFPPIDYAILIGILLVIATVGFMQGVAVGLAAVLVMFVINYSRIDVVRRVQTGESYRSRVSRSLDQQQLLSQVGSQLLLLHLQGFLFFGTANKLLERLRAALQQPSTSIRYVLLDFQQVTGMDSTAVLSFLKLEQLAAKQEAYLLIADASHAIRQSLSSGGFGASADPIRYFPDVDHALEWYEGSVLASIEQASSGGELRQLFLNLSQADQSPLELVDWLLERMQRLELPAGHVLLRQGDPPDDIYFIETGQVTAQFIRPDGQPVRMQTMLGGQVVGEVGFYLNVERSASVVVEAPSVVYRLSRQGLRDLEATHPESAAALHRLIVRLLSKRVLHLTRVVDALQ